MKKLFHLVIPVIAVTGITTLSLCHAADAPLDQNIQSSISAFASNASPLMNESTHFIQEEIDPDHSAETDHTTWKTKKKDKNKICKKTVSCAQPQNPPITSPYKIVWEKHCSQLSNFDEGYQNRIKVLIDDIVAGIKSGHVEPLKGNLKGYLSRRITQGDRLVYRLDKFNKTLSIFQCLGHYKK